MKKTFACILAAVLLFSCGFAVQAAVGNSIINGDFEHASATQMPASWRTNGCTQGEDCDLSDIAHGGGQSFHMFGENQIIYQAVDIQPGASYTLSAFLRDDLQQGAAIKLEFGNTEKYFYNDKDILERFTGKNGKWTEVKIPFTAAEDATRVAVLLRLLGNGDIYWDDVTLTGEVAPAAQAAIEKAEAKRSLVSDVVSSGEVVEFLTNNSFETLAADGTPASWRPLATTFGETAEIVGAAKDGKNAVRMHGKSAILSQNISGFVPGKTYTLTAWLREETAGGAAIKLEFANADGFYGDDDFIKELSCTRTGTWEQKTVQFVVPVGATSAAVMVRLLREGDICWDNVSLQGEKALIKPEKVGLAEVKPPVEGSGECIENGGFETVNADGISPTGWMVFGTEWKGNAYVTLTDEKTNSGKKAVKISKQDGTAPWVCQLVRDVTAGAEYQLHAFLSSELTGGGGAVFKLEFYSENRISAETSVRGNDASTPRANSTGGAWCEYTARFRVPKGAVAVAIYPRLFSNGTVYFDDVSLTKTDNPVAFALETDQTFYYSDRTADSIALVRSDLDFYPALANGSASFSLSKDDTVLLTKSFALDADGNGTCTFPPALLTEKKAEYTVSVTATAQDNKQYTYTVPVYRYDRPKRLNAQGEYVIDGEVFNPVIMYHADPEFYPQLAAAGVNVVQSYPRTVSSKEMLDIAQENNIKVLYALYGNMLPPGNPANVEKATQTIQNYKDHPALFGWMIMDEPYLNNPDIQDELVASYKLIRDLDDEHPTYILEAPINPGKYNLVGKCGDIFAIDPYPGGGYLGDVTSFVEENVALAQAAVYNEKPIYVIQQTFDWPTDKYMPTVADYRNFMYQAYFAGATANGYYCYEDAIGGKHLDTTDLLGAIGDFETTFCREAFLEGKYKNFSETRTEDFWQRTFEKDGKLFMALQNRKNPYDYEKETLNVTPKTTDTTAVATVPLTNFDGTITLSDYKAEVMAGEASLTTGSGSLTVTLPAAGTALICITPDNPTDFSALTASRYVDLYNYPWARHQIERLRAKGIVNDATYNTYAPAKKITRGEFAGFLVRTLGLTSDSTENFADVDANAAYAKEIAIGKACAILKGTDGVNYMPEAEISRQDLMVICARGMRLKKTLEEGAETTFSDAAAVSDYAVADIAAMVRLNIVKGNADGTLNPLGNTTRAEAAVIMDRISGWNAQP